MCGVCGVAYSDPARQVDAGMLSAMTQTLRHRGPDGEGQYVAPGVGLGIRRLSIIDLETGHQPISNEDDTVVVVGNGEIYNFQELRGTLLARGHAFRTRSDIEVIVHLYEEHGVDCLQHLRGMFGFALWDARRRCLVLARDRLGIKPLHYAETAEGVFFGSEIKAIVAGDRIERRLDIHALHDILTIGFVLAPKTLFAAIRQVLPGHYLLYERGTLSTHRYWDLGFPDAREGTPRRTADEWAAELRQKLDESVRLHLRSDVPVGAWLSSGVDSSAVVALMRSASGSPVSTFTLGFENPRFDEVTRNRILSDFPEYGLQNQRAICSIKDVALLRRAIWHAEDPQTAAIEIPRMVLSELTARHVKVALSGEGSDEMFGGYGWFRTYKYFNPLTRLPLGIRAWIGRIPALKRRWPSGARIFAAPAEMNLARYRQTIDSNLGFDARLLSDELRQELTRKADEVEVLRLPERFGRWHYFSQLLYLETRVRLPNFVTRLLDSISMAHGLEVRVPFLDHEVVELCARIPPALKMRRTQEKYILRHAMRRDLPATILWRRKRGLMAPYGEWLRHLPDAAADLLSPTEVRRRGYFDARLVTRMRDEHLAGDAGHAKSLLGVLAVHLWDDLFMNGTRGVAGTR